MAQDRVRKNPDWRGGEGTAQGTSVEGCYVPGSILSPLHILTC